MRDIDDYSEEQNIFYGRCRGAKEAALNALVEVIDIASSLTNRERDVYKLKTLRNYSHKEIAEALGITSRTSKNYYSSAMAKVRILSEKEINIRSNDK